MSASIHLSVTSRDHHPSYDAPAPEPYKVPRTSSYKQVRGRSTLLGLPMSPPQDDTGLAMHTAKSQTHGECLKDMKG